MSEQRQRRAGREVKGCPAGLPSMVLGALLLAGCASSESTPPPAPPVCPSALILQGAERTAAYAPGAGTSADALQYIAVMTNLASACNYLEAGVDVDIAFDLIAERGPALEGDAVELTFFVATVGPGEEILSRPLLTSEIVFDDNERAGWTEQLTLRLPVVTVAKGAAYTLYLGFQLDSAELEERLQPLLR